jgi:hypothetical protein
LLPSSVSRNEQLFILYQQIQELDPEFTEAHIVVADTLYGRLNPSNFRKPPPGYTISDLKNRLRDEPKPLNFTCKREPSD